MIKIVILLVTTVLVVQINSIYIEIGENIEHSIQCSTDESIEIREAKWIHKGFPSQCKWDATNSMQKICNYYNECTFKPTREWFGSCGYNMWLIVNFECVYDIYNLHKIDKSLECYLDKYCSTRTRPRRSNDFLDRIEYCASRVGKYQYLIAKKEYINTVKAKNSIVFLNSRYINNSKCS